MDIEDNYDWREDHPTPQDLVSDRMPVSAEEEPVDDIQAPNQVQVVPVPNAGMIVNSKLPPSTTYEQAQNPPSN